MCLCLSLFKVGKIEERERFMNFFNQFLFFYDLFVSLVLWGVKILNL